MKPEYVQTETELETLCRRLNDRELIAFDTEFVAEDSYRPQLCLVQVAVHVHIAIIDPSRVPISIRFGICCSTRAVKSLCTLVAKKFFFVFAPLGKTIPNLFDVQIAVVSWEASTLHRTETLYKGMSESS